MTTRLRAPERLVAGIASLALACALGCAPVPTRTTPHVIARLRRAAAPLSRTPVEWLSWSWKARQFMPVASAITDDTGRVEFAEKRTWQWQPLMGDRLVKWRLQAHEGAEPVILWQQARVGSEPSGIVLDCDVSQEQPCVLTDSSDPYLRADGKRLPVADRRK